MSSCRTVVRLHWNIKELTWQKNLPGKCAIRKYIGHVCRERQCGWFFTVGNFPPLLPHSKGKFLFQKTSVSVKHSALYLNGALILKCRDPTSASQSGNFRNFSKSQSSGYWGSFTALSSASGGLSGILRCLKHSLLSNACSYRVTEAI